MEGVPDLSPASPEGASGRDTGPVAPLVASLLAASCLAIGSSVWVASGSDGVDPNLRVSIVPADVLSLLLLGLWVSRTDLRELAGRLRSSRLVGGLAAGLGALMLIAFVVHPSPRGVEFGLRVAAAAATADLLRRLTDATARRAVLAAVVIVGVVQALLAMAQSAKGQALGIAGLEFTGPLYPFGSSFAGRGGFGHPYHLACLLAVACGAAALGVRRQPRPAAWAAGLAVCCAGIGATFSRSALLGLAAMVGVALATAVVRRDRRAALVALAVVLGLAVGMTAFGDGWLAKTSASTDASRVDTGRRQRASEAIDLTRSSPLVGVGPGRYVEVLHARTGVDSLPAHNVALQEAAEAGVLAGVLAGLALLSLGLRSAARGADALFVFLPLAPFFVLDAYPYTFPIGIAISGVWLGLLTRSFSGTLSADERAALAAARTDSVASEPFEGVVPAPQEATS